MAFDRRMLVHAPKMRRNSRRDAVSEIGGYVIKHA
jgi:hypothetical protein